MMTATSAAASSLPPVRTSYHVPLSLMASISEETISLWLKLGALEKLEQAVLDGYGDQLCGKTSRIPQVNKFLRQVPLFQSKIKEIHRAVSQGRLRDVQHLIDRKKLAFCRDQSGATPLHKAVIFGHQDIIQYLVGRYGGVIHVRDHQGRSPLHYAAFLPDGGEIYQFLLTAGADERAMDVYGRQPSHYVDGQNENTLRQLREGTGINGMRKIKPRYYNQSPGNKPQENGTKLVVSKMIVRELIADGNLDPLEDLVLQGYGDRLLGETCKDPRVQTFLNIVPMYMERIYDIHRAVMRDQLEHVVILLENRRLAMARDQLGATPLHKAVWFGHYKIAHFISHHFPETLNTLDLEGRTPLHYAAALRDNKHMYGIIVDADANKSIFDNKGKTADYYLQYPEHLNLDDVIKRCHKVNANYLANTANRIKGKSPTRQTPPPSNGSSSSPRSDDNSGSSKESGISGENGTEPEQMLAMLQKDTLAKRVDICSANIQRWIQARDMEKLERAVMEGYGEKVMKIQGDSEFDEQNHDDMILSAKMSEMVQTVNAIHTAVSNDDVSELQNQLNQRDYILAKDHMGMTPLHRAVLLGRTNVLKYLIDKFPETINVKNKEGRTALHYAAAMSRKDGQNLYKMLIQGGADPRVRDSHGRTSDYYKTHLLTLPNKAPKARAGNGVPTRHSEPLNRYSKQGVLERMTVALQRGDVDLLQELVLEGHGRHLLGKSSWNDDVKQFLKELPNYLITIQYLHSAVREGKVDMVKDIVTTNEKLLKARDENGACPIHIAAQIGQSEVMGYLLLNHQSILNCKDGMGRTAMHIVGQDGNSAMYKRLKESGADPKILDQKGRTAEFYLQNAKGESHTYKINGNFEAPKKLIEEKQLQNNSQQAIKTANRNTHDKRILEPGNIRKSETVCKTKNHEMRKMSTTNSIGNLAEKKALQTASLIKESTPDNESDESKPKTQDYETYDDSFDEETGENDEGKSEDSDHFDENGKDTVSEQKEEQEADESNAEGNKKEIDELEEESKSEDQENNETSVKNDQSQKQRESSADKDDSMDLNISDKSDSREGVDDTEVQDHDYSESVDNETITTEQSNEVKSTELSLQTEKEDEDTIATENDDEYIIDEKNTDTKPEEQNNIVDTKANVEETGRTVAEVGSSHSDRSTSRGNTEPDDNKINADVHPENENDSEKSNLEEKCIKEETSDKKGPADNIDEDKTQTLEAENNENLNTNEEEIVKSSETNENVSETQEENLEDGKKNDGPPGNITNDTKEETDQEANEEKDQVAEAEVEKDKEAETEKDKKAETEKDKEAEAEKDKEAEAEKDKEAEAEKDKEAEAEKDTEAEEEKDKKTEAEVEKDKEAEVEKDKEIETEKGQEIEAENGEEKEKDQEPEKEKNPCSEYIKSSDESEEQVGKEAEVSQSLEKGQIEKDSSEKISEEIVEKNENKTEEQAVDEKENKMELPNEVKEEITENEANQEINSVEENAAENIIKSDDNDEKSADKVTAEDADQSKPVDSGTKVDMTEEEEPNKKNDVQNDNADTKDDTNNAETATGNENSGPLPKNNEIKAQDGETEQQMKVNESNEEQAHQTKDHLDELIEHWIKEGDLLRLEHVVLAGQGDRLIERTSEDKQVQDFLDLVPIYMAKIRAVHEAVVKGQLRDVRSILTRKRFALSRDHVGASPLHLAVLHGHSDVATYIISHFPETMDGPDNEGRTPLHYASALPDNGALYKILKVAGADENIEDKSGHSPKYYFNRHGDLTLSEILEPYMTSE